MQWKKKRKGKELMKQLSHTKSAQERRKRLQQLIVLVVVIICVLASRNFKLSKTIKPKVGVVFDE